MCMPVVRQIDSDARDKADAEYTRIEVYLAADHLQRLLASVVANAGGGKREEQKARVAQERRWQQARWWMVQVGQGC